MYKLASVMAISLLLGSSGLTFAAAPGVPQGGPGPGGQVNPPMQGAGGGGGVRRGAGGNPMGANGGPRGGRGGAGNPGGGALGINFAFYQNEFAILTQHVQLSPEQMPRVRDRIDAMNAELQNLLQQRGPGAMNPGGPQAGPGGGRGGRGLAGGPQNPNPQLPQGPAPQPGMNPPPSMTPQQIQLRDAYLALADDHQVKITAELNPDQKLHWETVKLDMRLNPKLSLLVLSDDQRQRIQAIVQETAKVLAALTEGKEIQNFHGKLFRRVMTEVLTDAQAAKFIEFQPAGPGGPGPGGGGQGNAAALQALAEAQASLEAAQAALGAGNPGGPPNGPANQGGRGGRGGARGGRGGGAGGGGGFGNGAPQ